MPKYRMEHANGYLRCRKNGPLKRCYKAQLLFASYHPGDDQAIADAVDRINAILRDLEASNDAQGQHVAIVILDDEDDGILALCQVSYDDEQEIDAAGDETAVSEERLAG